MNNNAATYLDSQISIDLDLHEPNHDIGLDKLAAKTSAELFQESPVVDQFDGNQIQMADVSFVNSNKETEIEELGKEFLNHMEEVEDELLEYNFKRKSPESQTGESKEVTVISDEECLSVVNPVGKRKKQTNKSSPRKRFDFEMERQRY